MAVKISSTPWGVYKNEQLFLFKLVNDSGASVGITNFGATVASITVKDSKGKFENVVAGFDSPEGYINDTCYIGSTIGRYANRISGARFILDGAAHNLEANDGLNTNHGGHSGFNRKAFHPSIENDQLKMTLRSEDGDGGYPGNLDLAVNYSWNDNNELLINYQAATDKNTIANFTNHSYFNLSAFKSKIHFHKLTINAARMLSLQDDYTPDGTVVPAGKNAFRNDMVSNKFKLNNDRTEGLNSFYIIDHTGDEQQLAFAAALTEETSGRILEVFTNYPGLFLYTGDYLHSTCLNPLARPWAPFDGLCIECQYYPDSINHPEFPQAVLKKGCAYNKSILFKFGTL